MLQKFPRIPHLPWSLGTTRDDLVLKDKDFDHFLYEQIVITEKLDGECTTMYTDYIHARSLEPLRGESRSWVKALHSSIKHNIPDGWRICGENLQATHSIYYWKLPSYFFVFAIFDHNNTCLSWDETIEWSSLLGLETTPVMDHGICIGILDSELMLDKYKTPWSESIEGYVVRTADAFHGDFFGKSCAKYVRANHITTDEHWAHKVYHPNGLLTSISAK